MNDKARKIFSHNFAIYLPNVMDAWISSKVRPLVSGTSIATNMTVEPQITQNMKKVPVIEISIFRISISITCNLQNKDILFITRGTPAH